MFMTTIRQANIGEVRILQNHFGEIFVGDTNYDDDLRTDWAQSEDGGTKYFTDLLNNDKAVNFFVKTIGVFGMITAVVLILLFSGLI